MLNKCKICNIVPKSSSTYNSSQYNNGTHKVWCSVCKSEVISEKSLWSAKVEWNKQNAKNCTG
jgi:hypothetical protein